VNRIENNETRDTLRPLPLTSAVVGAGARPLNEKRINVLIIGRSKAALDQIEPLIREDGFNTTSVTTNDDAIVWLERGRVAVVVVGDGVHGDSRQRVQRAAEQNDSAIVDAALNAGDGEAAYVRDRLLSELHNLANC
jgi:hypothetical protein